MLEDRITKIRRQFFLVLLTRSRYNGSQLVSSTVKIDYEIHARLD